MIGLGKPPRSVLLAFAVVFAAATIFYTCAWMYYARWQPRTEPVGISFAEPAGTDFLQVTKVAEGGAAAEAGLRAGDRLATINGRPMHNLDPFFDHISRGLPGDKIAITYTREGSEGPRRISLTLRAPPVSAEPASTGAAIASELANSYPLLFLIVGLYVLFVRVEDRHAWMLALLFAAFIAGPAYENIRPFLHPVIRPYAMAYALTFAFLGPSFFYSFFTTFPDSSPIERRAPWLKWAGLAVCAAVALPSAASLLFQGLSYPFYVQAGWVAPEQFITLSLFVLIGFVLLGFVALISNAFEEKDAQARRRFRVVLWGTIVGFGPEILRLVLSNFGVLAARDRWVQLAALALLMLVPVSMAYAVVKHRVMEIPLLLKRSARYVIARRGFDLALLALGYVSVETAAGRVGWPCPWHLGRSRDFPRCAGRDWRGVRCVADAGPSPAACSRDQAH